MPKVECFITWPGDSRRIVIEGEMSVKAFEYLKNELNEKGRELINICGIAPTVVQVGAEEEPFQEQRERARVTADVNDVLDVVADLGEDTDDDDDADDEVPTPSYPKTAVQENEVSEDRKVVLYKMPFGKYGPNREGGALTLDEISMENPGYLDWAVDNIKSGLAADMIAKAVKIPAIARRIDKWVHR